MKFGSVWRHTMATMPTHLRDACLDYKKFKKLSKEPTTSVPIIKAILDGDLHRTTHIFQTHLSGLQSRSPPTPSTFLCSLFKKPCVTIATDSFPPTSISPNELYRFATFNTTTLYKICKRLDKRHQSTLFTQWYRKAINDKAIAFVNKNVQSYLAIHASSSNASSLPPEECPICFEDPTKDGLILDCGHILCTRCVLSMLGVSHRTKGTLHNLISHGTFYNPTRAKCPICRDPHAFTRYMQLQNGTVVLR